MSAKEIVLTIQLLLDGTVWTASTLEEIATLLRENGYDIRDADGSVA
jgi:hypothetical protein